MPKWTSLKVWSRLSDKLSTAVGREFEKELLPWLRIIWPGLTQPPEIGHWDRKGVDLALWSDNDGMAVAVQCKGFEVPVLGESQLQQAKKSIEKFRDKGVRADQYLLVYNRPGSNRDFHRNLTESASELVTLGLVRSAEIWSREDILKHVFDAMSRRLDAKLSDSAKVLRQRFEHLADLKLPFIDRVPIRVSELRFKRFEPCEVKELLGLLPRDSKALLLAGHDYRWTLVVGLFGLGKTTAVLQASSSDKVIPIYVPAKALPTMHLRSGTSLFLTEILRILGFYEDLELDSTCSGEVGVLTEKLAGSILGYLLRQPDSGYLLILDALDENRAYCTLDGMQHLSNQLAEFRCQVILTTRREQFAEQFGNFGVAMAEASAKYGPKRPARLLEFEEWTPEIIGSTAREVALAPHIDNDAKARLEYFVSLVSSGEYVSFYGELPKNPLFLSFILEDVAEAGVRTSGRGELIRRWVARKIRRDRISSERPTPDETLDINALVVRLFAFLRTCAGSMFEESDGRILMTESIEEETLLALASQVFAGYPASPLSILLNSVLVPIGYRDESGIRAGFIFQVLQEYFLADFWVNNGFPIEKLPMSVKSFCDEMVKQL